MLLQVLQCISIYLSGRFLSAFLLSKIHLGLTLGKLGVLQLQNTTFNFSSYVLNFCASVLEVS